MTARPIKSASNANQWLNCPGSGNMQKGLAEQESEWSGRGTMLHKLYFTGERHTSLSPDEIELLDTADALTEKFFQQVRETFGIGDDVFYDEFRESPLNFRTKDGEILFPGHPDLIRVWPSLNIVAIADLKTGMGAVDEAPDNLQLATYAVMAHQAAGMWEPRFAVAIVQPSNFGPKLTVATYTGQGLEAARVAIEAAYLRSEKPDAPLKAGPWCTYCRAKAICDEYTKGFQQLATRPDLTAVAKLSNDDLASLYEIIQRAGKLKDEVKGELITRIESEQIPDWKLKNNGDVREVTKSIEMFHAFREVLLPEDATVEQSREFAAEYNACLAMQWGKLTDLVLRRTGIKKSQAEQLVERITEPFVTKTPKAKSPQRIK